MTYTTVHKDYEGKTLDEALAKAMQDPDIFNIKLQIPAEDPATATADNKGYSIESWEWRENLLRVNFR